MHTFKEFEVNEKFFVNNVSNFSLCVLLLYFSNYRINFYLCDVRLNEHAVAA
jgi:hypothetical protein